MTKVWKKERKRVINTIKSGLERQFNRHLIYEIIAERAQHERNW